MKRRPAGPDTPQVELRAATSADAQTLALVGAATFLESYAGLLDGANIVAHCELQHSPDIYRRWLADPAVHIWIAQAARGAAPLGYLVLTPAAVPIADPQPTDYEVKRIYLLGLAHGAGWGSRLMRLAIDSAQALGARRLLVGVYDQNHRAIAFYRHLGFRIVGERQFRVGAAEYHDHILGLDLGT